MNQGVSQIVVEGKSASYRCHASQDLTVRIHFTSGSVQGPSCVGGTQAQSKYSPDHDGQTDIRRQGQIK